ncbi:hypothetical protein AB0945_40000 [Streptomyces sp. NPDC005474]|uniref:hypothetical protein n=1 Tax=Streptomyces sp. NPDC005474 TaxID=3154878 RepID=UPI003453FFFA
MALAYRLRDLDLLSEWRYTQTVKKLAQMGYRTGEPGFLLARESSPRWPRSSTPCAPRV